MLNGCGCPQVLEQLSQGASVAVISDAGNNHSS